MNKLKIGNLEEMKMLNKNEIDKRAYEYDKAMWLQELEKKSTLTIYKQHKTDIKEENFYDNSYKSILMYRARSNTLQLGWRKRYIREDVSCQLSRTGKEESLEHFLIQCRALEDIRIHFGLQDPQLSKILLFEEDGEIEKYKELIKCLWKKREQLSEERRT